MDFVTIKMKKPSYCDETCPLSIITGYGEYLECRLQEDAEPADRYDDNDLDKLFDECPFKKKNLIDY